MDEEKVDLALAFLQSQPGAAAAEEFGDLFEWLL